MPVLRCSRLAVSGSDSLERLAMEHSTIITALSFTRPLHCHALLSRGDLCLRANSNIGTTLRLIEWWVHGLVYMCTIITSQRYRHPSTSALSSGFLESCANLQELLRGKVSDPEITPEWWHCENTRLATVEICDVNQKQVLYLRLRPLSILYCVMDCQVWSRLFTRDHHMILCFSVSNWHCWVTAATFATMYS